MDIGGLTENRAVRNRTYLMTLTDHRFLPSQLTRLNPRRLAAKILITLPVYAFSVCPIMKP